MLDGGQRTLGIDVAEAAQVRRDDHVPGGPQRVFRRQRLLLEHVERGARDLVRFERLDHGGFVHDAAAGEIDEIARRLHGGEDAGIDAMVSFFRIGHKQHQIVELARVFDQLAAQMHAVEARQLAFGRGEADHGHVERRAARRQRLGDETDAIDADSLAVDQPGRPARPAALVLIAHTVGQPAAQRQHPQDGGFRHRLAMDAADIGDDHLVAQRRLVDDAVNAGPERLDPFQLAGGREHLVAQHRPECHQDLGFGHERCGLGEVIDDVDLQLRKALAQPRGVEVANLLRERQQDEQAAHSDFCLWQSNS